MDLSRFSLEGKVALITGGSQGIGRAAAIELAKAGADVVVVSRKMADLEKVAAEIESMGRNALPVAANISKIHEIDKMMEIVKSRFDTIDILVNNAATSPAYISILEAEERLWDSIMNLNLKGLYFLTQAVARLMKASGGGSVINVSSVDGFKPQKNLGIYSASKAAVNMLTKSAAIELAPYNIRVNGIAPGAVRTRFFEALFVHFSANEAEAAIQKMGDKLPLQRIGLPEEMAGALVYLASDASGYMTGETMVIDGGLLQVSPL
ncbi:MAG: SDR family oxidoreductase [Desulfobacteraceae bacterium]|nr:SDR family oxidoreductase [Desulfobacteraceae bacterium]MBC2758116.1 SDR family oxidoreductase [Desulfobacteraceae bacterium]